MKEELLPPELVWASLAKLWKVHALMDYFRHPVTGQFIFALIFVIHTSSSQCTNGICEKVSFSLATDLRYNSSLDGYVFERLSIASVSVSRLTSSGWTQHKIVSWTMLTVNWQQKHLMKRKGSIITSQWEIITTKMWGIFFVLITST